MNVSDFKDSKEYINYMDHGVIRGIYELQDTLIDAYVKIEHDNAPNNPYNIHRNLDINNTSDQLIIKILSQRVIEELVEMKMAGKNQEHVKEEFIDAITFATEMMILLGVTGDKFDDKECLEDVYTMTNWETDRMIVIDYLASATNCLKNKSWKKDQVLVDTGSFWRRIMKFYTSLLALGANIFGSSTDMFAYFYGKFSTNKFRQKSNY